MTHDFAPRSASDLALDSTATGPFVAGAPRTLLRLEGALVLVAATGGYAHVGLGWAWFAGLFLLPDLSLLGYLVDRRVGAIAYNSGHSYLTPGLLAALALLTGHAPLVPLALIWFAHIGFDRMLGYGLKYPTAFVATHLGVIGRAAGYGVGVVRGVAGATAQST